MSNTHEDDGSQMKAHKDARAKKKAAAETAESKARKHKIAKLDNIRKSGSIVAKQVFISVILSVTNKWLTIFIGPSES